MTITENINRIKQAKEDIKEAIIAKGVEVTDDVRIDGYAEKIGEIQQGGSGQFAIDYGEEIYTNNAYSMTAEQEDIDYYNQIQAERAAYAAGAGGRSDAEIQADPEFKRKIAWWPKGMKFGSTFTEYVRLKFLDASGFKLTGTKYNTFRRCISLNRVDNMSLEEATGIVSTFSYSGLKEANFNIPLTTNISSFFECGFQLTTIKFTSSANVENWAAFCSTCPFLKEVLIDDMSKATNVINMFLSCNKIETLRLGKVGITLSCTSPVLSPESIAYILRNRLKGKVWKLTLNATVKAKFLAKVDDGSIYEERDDSGEVVHTSTYAEIYTEAQSEVTLA